MEELILSAAEGTWDLWC